MQSRREYRSPREGEVAAFLSRHAKWVKAYGKELRFRPCPKCMGDSASNPSSQINMETGLWRCFGCGAVGNFFTLTRDFGAPLPLNDRYKDDANPIRPVDFERFFGIQRRPVTCGHHPDLLEYCRFRGIEDRTLDAWRVSTKGPEALRWPIYAWTGRTWGIVNARIRVCLDRDSKNCTDWFDQKGAPTGLLIGNHLLNLQDPKKRAVIFEGQWDAMVGWQLGLENSFSLPNGAGSIHVDSMLRYIPDDWEVWLAMDEDEAGQRAVERFFAQLGPDRVGTLKMPYKDLNEWLVQNPSLCLGDVEDACTGLTRLTGGCSIQSGNYMDMDMDREDEPENVVLVCKTPFDSLNHMLNGGLRGGETTGLLAKSGTGKTSFCNQIAVYAAMTGTGVGLISVEGTRKALKPKIKDVVRGICKPEQYKETVSRLMISRLEGKRVKPSECVSEFESMIAKGARLLILDNLDHITGDCNSDKLAAYGELIRIATHYMVHVIVVWQPHKVDSSQRVNSGNQKGYSQTYQDADNYLNLNPVEDFIQLHMEKTRESGVDRINNKLWMVYDKKTRCFAECVRDVKIISGDNSGNVLDLTRLR